MKDWIPSFSDELEKIARLTKADERRQALQFAGLGAAAAPVVSGITNLLSYGRISPWGKVGRWLPAQVVGGALAGGALPAVRHAVERQNVRAAKARQDVKRELAQAKAVGVKVPEVINQ
jgi:hypothetical protein